MPVKKYKPVTPSRRFMTGSDFSTLTAAKPNKLLTKKLSKRAGRSKESGRITIRHKGGGSKRKYRVVDFKQNKYDIPAKVESIEYDPNRSGFISLIKYDDGEKSYIISPAGIKVGDQIVFSQKKNEALIGNRMPLRYIPDGTQVHNVELDINKGGQLAKSAGSSIQLIEIQEKYAHLKMPSGEIRKVLKDCMASVGSVSNPTHENVVIGKAGRNRWLGKRPTVRGKAMNPVDHPHGGGEGRAPIGLIHPKTPWGRPALGVKTRNKKKKSSQLILKTRKKRRR